MSSIHPMHRRLRHLRQVVCRNLPETDIYGCNLVLVDEGSDRELYQSRACADTNNPQWAPLPMDFINTYGASSIVGLRIVGLEAEECLFKVSVDMRRLKFVGKSMTAATASVTGPTILLRCVDGVYVVPDVGAPNNEDDPDWIVVKDDPVLSSRTDRTRIDAIQSWGTTVLGLSLQLHMLQDRRQRVANCVDVKALGGNMQGGHESVLSYRIAEVKSQKDQLLVAVRAKREALDARRDELAQQLSRAGCDDGNAPSAAPVMVDVKKKEEEMPMVSVDDLTHRRGQLLSRLHQYYAVDTSDQRINGRRIPDRDGFPENAEHAQGLGIVCHLLALYGDVYSVRLPHPVVLCGDHSRIAEHGAVTKDRYIPLFPSKAHDRLQLRRAVELLRANVMWMATYAFDEVLARTSGLIEQLAMLVKGPGMVKTLA